MTSALKSLSKLALIAILFVGSLSFSSCEKDDGPASTSLELEIKDKLGNSMPGTSVKLYATEIDFQNKTNQIGATQVSDSEGKVTFNDLAGIQYYWFAEKGCENNYNGGVTTATPLTLNGKNTVSTVLEPTATLMFENTSNDMYRVYINGTAVFDMEGGTTRYRYYAETGSYSIRVEQKTGIVLTPIDETYNGVAECGQTLTTTFPK